MKNIFKNKEKHQDVKNSNNSSIEKWALPSYGIEPFRIAFFMLIISIVFSFFLYEVSTRSDIWVLPKDVFNDLFQWTITSLFIPHVVIYFISLISSLLILPLKGIKYAFWIMKQSIIPIIVSFFAVEAVIFLIMGILLSSASEQNIRVREDIGMSVLANDFWYLSLFSVSLVLWNGYKVGWKAYRSFGAKTMQQRFHEYQDKILVKNSGQIWEKYVETFSQKISGKDGEKPRGGFLYVLFISHLCIFSSFMIGLYVKNTDTYLPLSIIFSSLVLFTQMAITKARDTTKKKVEPKLIPVRDQNSVDKYNPELSSVSRW